MLSSALHMLSVNVNYLEGGMLFNLCLIGYPMLFSFLNLQRINVLCKVVACLDSYGQARKIINQ